MPTVILTKLLKSLQFAAKRWCRHRRANVAMIAALSIVPFVSVIGLAIDFQYVQGQRTKVQAAVDAAILQGARLRQAGVNENEIERQVQNYFNASIGANSVSATCDALDITFSRTSQDIDAGVLCHQATIFGLVLGKQNIDFEINTASTYGIGKLDVAFVFDSSGSMGGQKLTDLKDAARTAVDTILPEYAVAAGDIRIAMVTYSTQLNAGEYYDDVVESTTYTTYGSWKWTTATSGKDCNGETRQKKKKGKWVTEYKCRTVTVNSYDNTCVWERGGSDAFTAEPPGAGDWLTPVANNSDDCPPTTPLPLTNDRDALLDYIDDLTAGGYTAGHLGTAWGWYLVAPEWKDIWPAESEPLAYDEPDSAKAIILMTDGSFNKYFVSGQGDSSDQAMDLCDNAKAAGVIIYSVAFQAPADAQATLDYCATGPEFSFNPENGQELEQSYQAIAASINDLRISR